MFWWSRYADSIYNAVIYRPINYVPVAQARIKLEFSDLNNNQTYILIYIEVWHEIE